MKHRKHFSWSCPASIVGLLAGCPMDEFATSGQSDPTTSGGSPAPTSGPPTSGPMAGNGSSTGPASTGDATTSDLQDDTTTSDVQDDTTTGNDTTAIDTTAGGDTIASETSAGASTDAGDASSGGTTGTAPDDTTGAPEPPPTYVISVVVKGLVDDEALVHLNGDETLELTGPGELAFMTQLAAGAAYTVALEQLPTYYACAVQGGAGTMPAHDITVTVACAPKPSTTLVIAEVGFGYALADSHWLEIVNVSAQPQSLDGVTLRSPTFTFDVDYKATDKGVQELALPAVQLAPGERLVLRGAVVGETAPGPGLALLSLPGGALPAWRTAYGALELRKAGASIDYVAWGTIPLFDQDALAPAHPSAWPGYPAALPVPPAQEFASRGRSLARALAPVDGNTTPDFTTVEFSTPGGPNDTHGCVVDADSDGLPDCAEAPGSTYAGVDLYGYGARPDWRDIFVEIDAMNPKGADGVTLDPGMVPSKVALDRIVAQFKPNKIALHFDVGDLFDKAPGIDLANHDLGGGGALPFAEKTCFDPGPGCAWMVDLKAKNFALARLKSFHYAVYGNRTATGTLGGQGERPGNDLYVSFGGHTFKTTTTLDTYVLINNQTQTLMHELGHNLGLSHGGFSTTSGAAQADEANWKPNYFSVMNYLYNTGLPAGTVGDRYYYEHEDENPACKAKGVDFCAMSVSMCDEPAKFRVDYSHGLGGAIDTAAVVESHGLKQPGSVGVDFDCDGVVEAQPYASKLYAAVDGANVPLTLLRDHDDWGALDLFFARSWNGVNNGEVRGPAARDVQPRSAVDDLPPTLLAWLRRR